MNHFIDHQGIVTKLLNQYLFIKLLLMNGFSCQTELTQITPMFTVQCKNFLPMISLWKIVSGNIQLGKDNLNSDDQQFNQNSWVHVARSLVFCVVF